MNLFLTTAHAEEAAAEPTPTWLQTAFKKFGEMPIWLGVTVAVLLLAGIAVYAATRKQSRTVWSAKMLSVGAICMALSVVLSMIRLYRMPQGGSITPASMLPLILFAFLYGPVPGFTLGALYGVLQALVDAWFAHWAQFLLDYPLAYAMMGLAGFFRVKNDQDPQLLMKLSAGICVASVARGVMHLLSGVIFFAEYAPEGVSPWIYSLGYNASYILPEIVICIALAAVMGRRLVREMYRLNK